MTFIFIILLIFFIFSLNSVQNSKEKKKALIKNQQEEAENLKEEILKLKEEIKNLLSYENYLNNRRVENYNGRVEKVLSLAKNNLFLKEIIKKEKLNIIHESKVKKYNEKFIEIEKENTSEFFNDIDGKSLDNQQREAVIKDEDNNLVVAGAGSGKTLTISAKVKYLVQLKNIQPNEILLISFTKAAAEEMYSRIKNKLGLDVKTYTFHKLGFELLNKLSGQKYNVVDNPGLFINSKTISQLIITNEEFSTRLFEYLTFYPTDKITEIDENIQNKSEYFYTTSESLEPFSLKLEKKTNNIVNNLKILHYKKYGKDVPFNKQSGIELLGTSTTSKNLKKFIENLPDNVLTYSSGEEEIFLKRIEEMTEKDKRNFDINKYYIYAGVNYKNTPVRSEEEKLIANFLFIHGVEFLYEATYKGGKYKEWKNYDNGSHCKLYTPDFYLPEYDIYLEHFGVDKDMKPHQYSPEANEKYVEAMKWKRKVHELNQTKLIETYSFYHQDGELLEKLKDLLVKNGVKLKLLSKEEINMYLELTQSDLELDTFLKLIHTFLNLFKSLNYNLNDLKRFKKQAEKLDSFTKRKHLLFFSLFETLYQSYIDKIGDKSIDFNDMINNATTLLEQTTKTTTELGIDFKYIIIDEFQDTSISKFKLVKAIMDKTNANIMVVGDDWQSIYRFAGSDLSVFTYFEKFFGKSTISLIEKTYRNSQELINVAQRFVMKNPKQIKKNLKSDKTYEKPVVIHNTNCKDSDAVCQKVIDILNNILEYDNSPNIEIMMLARTNSDFEVLNNSAFFEFKKDKNDDALLLKLMKEAKIDLEELKRSTKEEIIERIIDELDLSKEIISDLERTTNRKSQIVLIPKIKNSEKLHIKLLTAHSSKGLEADHVIILNVVNALTGFPNKIIDDSVLKYVLTSPDEYLYGEERRLFYVALTRTRLSTHLITENYNESIFINELKQDVYNGDFIENNFVENVTTSMLCPVCGGNLVGRKNTNNGKNFLGCIHFPRCNFSLNLSIHDINPKTYLLHPMICPKCKSATLVQSKFNEEEYYCPSYDEYTHFKITKQQLEEKLQRYKVHDKVKEYKLLKKKKEEDEFDF